MSLEHEGDKETPVAHDVATGPPELAGPCSHVACPLVDGEPWAPETCPLDDACPRQARLAAAKRRELAS